MRSLISSCSPFEATVGYSRAVVDGDFCFVAGTTGFDYRAMTISDDPVAQTRQAFVNIRAALEEAGFSLSDVVRARYIVPRADDCSSATSVARPLAAAGSYASKPHGGRTFVSGFACRRASCCSVSEPSLRNVALR